MKPATLKVVSTKDRVAGRTAPVTSSRLLAMACTCGTAPAAVCLTCARWRRIGAGIAARWRDRGFD